MRQLLYLPVMAPCDFPLFPEFKKSLKD